jgi:hypothetical protein
MKKILLLIALFFNTISVYSQSCEWAVNMIGFESIVGCTTVALDSSGNIYAAGIFYTKFIEFDKKIILEKDSLSKSNIFVTKYDKNGKCLWAQKISHLDNNTSNKIVTDKFGNIFILGEYKPKEWFEDFSSEGMVFNNNIVLFRDNADFGFIAKYDSTGKCRWAKSLGGKEHKLSFKFDGSGIYISGNYCNRTMIFDNDIFILSNGNCNSYIAELNTDGKFVSAYNIGGNKSDYIKDICSDKFGNIYYIGGIESDSIEFNNNKKIFNNKRNSIYYAKINYNGIYEYSSIICYLPNYNLQDFKLDNDSNFYIAGYYISDSLIFNNAINLDKSINADGFLAKFNETGKCQWAEKISGNGTESVKSIAIDLQNEIYFAGDYDSSPLKFNNNISVRANGGSDAFISKYDKYGKCKWVEKIGGEFHESISEIILDKDNNFYISGYYESDTLKFNSGVMLADNKFYHYFDGFLAKYSPKPSIVQDSEDNKNIILYPNPASDFITISIPENSNHILLGAVENGHKKIQIFNTLGLEVAQTPSSVISGNDGGNLTQTGASELLRIDISHLPVGVYFVKFGNNVEKFIKSD